MKALYMFEGWFWDEMAELDKPTTVSTSEGEWTVRMPLEDQKQAFRNVAREGWLNALAKRTPEERHATYRRLCVRVTAFLDGRLEIELCTPITTTSTGTNATVR